MVHLSLEFTPNPNTLKYVVNQTLFEKGAANFTDPERAAEGSPLAAELFAIPGITGVMFGKNFVTLSKADDGDWDEVHQKASGAIQAYLDAGKAVFVPAYLEQLASQKGGSSAVAARIEEILENEIRPAVAMDGGDITFDRYEDGVVYLHLRGACAGCPGAEMTLKLGVENRLRQAIPEVREVVSV